MRPAALLALWAAVAAVPFHAVPTRAETPAEGRSLADSLAAEGDRYFARGQYRTAVKLYQVHERSLGAPSAQAVLYRWGVAHFRLGEYAEAADKFGRMAPDQAPPGVPERLPSLYLGYTLVLLKRTQEALPVLRRVVDDLEEGTTGEQAGLALAACLAEAGEKGEAALLLDRLHREAAADAQRERIMAVFRKTADGLKSAEVVSLVVEGLGAEPSRGAFLPWLVWLASSGRTARLEEILEAMKGRETGEDLRGELDRLRLEVERRRGLPEVRIGALLPLSGDYQFFGRKILQAVNLALEGRSDLKVTLLVRDTRGDPETGRLAAEELMGKEGIKAVIGPIISSVAEKVALEAEKRKVPVISPAAQLPGLPALSRYFFRNNLTLQQQGRAMARTAVTGLGFSRFVVLYPRDNYGKALSRAFWDEVVALGGRIVRSTDYGLEQTDFSREIKIIRGEEEVEEVKGKEPPEYHPDFDAVYIPDTYNRVGLIAPQLSFHDIDRQEVTILGSSGLNSPEFVRLGEDYVEGTIFLDCFFAGRASPEVRDFVARYRSSYGEDPDALAAQAFDAAGILLSLVAAGRTEPESIREGLAGLKDYPGVCGLTGMDADREAAREPVRITVLKGHLVELVVEH